jgi:hypothetical protein
MPKVNKQKDDLIVEDVTLEDLLKTTGEISEGKKKVKKEGTDITNDKEVAAGKTVEPKELAEEDEGSEDEDKDKDLEEGTDITNDKSAADGKVFIAKEEEEGDEDEDKKMLVGESADDEDESDESDEEGDEDEDDDEDDEDDEDESDDDEDEDEMDFTEDVAALNKISGTSLSEDYKSKAASIFEAAVTSRVREKATVLREKYQIQLDEKVATVTEQLTSQIDSYLTNVVENWLENNKVAVDTSLRADIAESFIKSLHGVFTEHYVDVPASKKNVFEELSTKVATLEKSVKKASDENKELKESVVAFKRADVIREATAGLSATQVEKLTSLVESVAYESDEQFASKVKTIAEGYITKKSGLSDKNREALNESTADSDKDISPTVKAVLNVLRKKDV